MHRVRSLALLALTLGAACHEFRTADPMRPRVEPVRVEFATPQNIILRRQSDSILVGVHRLDGTLVWSDRDSLRVGVTSAELADGWHPIQAPSDAVVPMGSAVRVEHRVLSKTRTAAVIAGMWAATVALIVANLK
jgi:hypothetical protein